MFEFNSIDWMRLRISQQIYANKQITTAVSIAYSLGRLIITNKQLTARSPSRNANYRYKVLFALSLLENQKLLLYLLVGTYNYIPTVIILAA